MGSATSDRADGFGAFFRRYARTWQHAVATAALTAFGTLTFVHRLFAVLAILAYVLPPLVLYLRGPPWKEGGTTDGDRDGETSDRQRTRPDDHESERAEETPPDGPAKAGAHDADGDDPDDRDRDRAWRIVDVPSEASLFDVIAEGANAYAVGDGGVVLADGDEGWAPVVSDGPGAGSNVLRGVDAVEGGGVWFAGDGGAVGRLDPEGARHVDHSAPDGDTTNVLDVAAAAEGDTETVLLVDGSGRVRRGRYREGEVSWSEPEKPGSGSSLAGIVLCDGSRGYACDTSQCVFETGDGGRTFEEVSPDAVEGTLTDVAASGTDPVVSDDDGVVHRRDGTTWTPERLGADPLWALDRDGERGIACGEAGTVYELHGADTRWTEASTPTTASLRGVALGTPRALAVGEDGTIIERSGVGSDEE
ncbi:WD40/YVTN/BNR-like repeat-containing protein [Salinirubellus sp. GCM10025818]|uniref:WD40/YVTN/BNR-like repeat-containing protein n=1 Tax=Salinirubellus TaxID=2162630 RepID=UPI0030CF9EE7